MSRKRQSSRAPNCHSSLGGGKSGGGWEMGRGKVWGMWDKREGEFGKGVFP